MPHGLFAACSEADTALLASVSTTPNAIARSTEIRRDCLALETFRPEPTSRAIDGMPAAQDRAVLLEVRSFEVDHVMLAHGNG